jgi:hypothetical protein
MPPLTLSEIRWHPRAARSAARPSHSQTARLFSGEASCPILPFIARAKGRSPSSAAILALLSSSMVISRTLDFSRPISSSPSSRSRAFKAVADLQARDRATRLAERWRHSFAGHQVQRLAAQESRDDRDLALTIPADARRGTYVSFGGAARPRSLS